MRLWQRIFLVSAVLVLLATTALVALQQSRLERGLLGYLDRIELDRARNVAVLVLEEYQQHSSFAMLSERPQRAQRADRFQSQITVAYQSPILSFTGLSLTRKCGLIAPELFFSKIKRWGIQPPQRRYHDGRLLFSRRVSSAVALCQRCAGAYFYDYWRLDRSTYGARQRFKAAFESNRARSLSQF